MAAGGWPFAERANGTRGAEASVVLGAFPVWQVLVIAGVVGWLYAARLTLLTVRVRSILQPLVVAHVRRSVPFLLRVQRSRNPTLDVLLSALSYSVSVEFYTTFLPLLFWSGHSRLARNMTLLMALCIYLGNCLKDVVSAPRPPSPPVRKLLATHAEEESAEEYGLPSSHTINSLCLAGVLLLYLGEKESSAFWLVAALVGVLVVGVIYGRLYLGMHSPLDVVVGVMLGFCILLAWYSVEKRVNEFIVHGENVISFWATMAALLLVAYPSPEQRNPSYEFHTAFNGVAFGVVSGIHRTHALYHHDALPTLPLASIPGARALLVRLLVGLPLCLAVKTLSKELATRTLPTVCGLLGLQVHSSSYVPAIRTEKIAAPNEKTACLVSAENRKSSFFFSRFLHGSEDEVVLDIDTGIRALQYAGLGWSVVELAPQLYDYCHL